MSQVMKLRGLVLGLVVVGLLALHIMGLLAPVTTYAACCGGSSEADGVSVRLHIMMCVDGTADTNLQGRNIDDGSGGPDTLVTLTGSPIPGGSAAPYRSGTAYRTLVVDEEYTLSSDLTTSGTIATTHIGITVPEGYSVEIDRIETSEINKNEPGEDSWVVVIRQDGCCGGSTPGEASEPETGSVTWGVDLGALPNGESAGRIMLRETELNADSYTRARLIYSEPAGEYTGGNDFVTVTRDGNDDLTKIATDLMVAELTDLTSPNGVQIAFYENDGTGSKTGAAYAVWQITDTSPGGSPNTAIKFEKTTGGTASSDTYEVTYNDTPGGSADYSWTMVTGDGSGSDPDLRKVVRTTTITGAGVGQVRTDVIEIKDANDTVIRKTTEKYETFAWSEELVERILDPDGEALTTKWTYYDIDTEVGRYSQVKSIEYEDGRWVKYDYYNSTDVDALITDIHDGGDPTGPLVEMGKLGQLKQELHAWDDVALSSSFDENDVYSIDYDWEGLRKYDNQYTEDSLVKDQLLTEKHYIPDGTGADRDIIESKSYTRDFKFKTATWAPLDTYHLKETRYLDPENETDANQAIITEMLLYRYDVPADPAEQDWSIDDDSAGKPLWKKGDDGRMTVYQYEAGTYTDSGAASAASFSAAGDDGSFRVTMVNGVKLTAVPGGGDDVEYPNDSDIDDQVTNTEAGYYNHAVKLIANNSTKTTTVYDEFGRMALSEMYTWDGTSWTRRQWTVTRYNIEGQATSQYFHDGTDTSTTYGADDRISSMTDRRGLKTEYGYDEAGRRNTTTHYADVDSSGDVNAGDIILRETKTTYDAAGRSIKTERKPDGGSYYTVSETEYDDASRTSMRKDALGKLMFYTYNDVKADGSDYLHGTDTGPWFNETRTYPHDKDSGAVRVTWSDNNGSTVRQWSGTSTATWSEASPPSGAETLTEVARTTMAYEAPGRMITTRSYFDLASLALNQDGTKGTNYYESEVLAYDLVGRALRTKSAIGDITASVYDGERMIEAWRGLNDTSATIDDPSGGGSGGNDMIQVARQFYDSDRDGTGDELGYVTRSQTLKPVTTDPPTFSTSNTATDFEQTYTASGMESWSKPELGPWSKQVTDYQGRSVESGIYKNGNTSYLLTKSTSHYDDANTRPWRMTASRVHEVNGTGGTTGKYLETTYGYDDAERQVKSASTAGGFTKTAFDDENRVERRISGSDEGTNTDADAFTDDIVLTESVPTYDTLGNVVKNITYERAHDATATGLLSAAVASQSRVNTSLTWRDDAHRPTHQVNFGINTPSASYDDPTTDTAPEPNTSDDYIVVKYEYDAEGMRHQITDNLGRKNRTEFDDLGRTTKVIENYVDGAPLDANPDEDRVTTYVYNAAGQTIEQTADMEGTSNDQTTKYIYSSEVTDKGSPLKSNTYLRAIIMPDSDDVVSANALANGTDTTYDRIEMTYLANGQLATRKDQREIVLTSTYDAIGRQTEQEVTSGTVDGDQQFKTTYTDLSQPDTITAYSVADTTVSSEIEYAYNGYQQTTTEYQAHGGAVNTSTSPKIQYAYDTTNASSVHTKGHRLDKVTYPNGRVIQIDYSGNNGIDDKISRASELEDYVDGSSDVDIVGYTYLGSGRMARKDYTTPDVRLDFLDESGEGSDSNDDYELSWDAFGRPIRHQWETYAPGSGDAEDDLVHIAHAYDRNSNRLYDERKVATSYSKVMSHDEQDRITEMVQGKIKSDQSAIEPNWITGGAEYELNQLGSILGIDPAAETGDQVQKFEHNNANEPTAYESKGNQRLDPYFFDDFEDSATATNWELPSGSSDTFTIDSGGSGELDFTLSRDTYDGVQEPEPCVILLWKDSETIGLTNFAGELEPDSGKQVGFVFGYKSPNDYYIAVNEGNKVAGVYHIHKANPTDTVATKTFVDTVFGSFSNGNDDFAPANLREVFGGNDIPEGRIGLWSNTASPADFEEVLAYAENRPPTWAGRWKYTEATKTQFTSNGIQTSDYMRLQSNATYGKNRHSDLALARIDGMTVDKFQITFGVELDSAWYTPALRFAWQGDEDFVTVAIRPGSKQAYAFRYENESRTSLSPTTDSSAIPSVSSNDTIWVRYESDGSEIKGYVLNSVTKPSEASWTGLDPFVTVTSLPNSGQGGIGLGVLYSARLDFDDVTLKSDPDGDGIYDVTELVDSFTVDGENYRDMEPEHDAAGNLTFDGLRYYTYDAFNRLVKVENAFKDPDHTPSGGSAGDLAVGSMIAAYAYDANNRRIKKDTYAGGILDNVEHFYCIGGSLVETRNGSDQVTQQHVWDSLAGHYIDSLAQVSNNANPGGDDDGVTAGVQDLCEDDYYALQDQQFNILAITDDTGAVVERYEYSLYGERTIMNQTFVVLHKSGFAMNCGFQGLYHDVETGLIYNRARMLNSRLQRFNQRDIAGGLYPDGMNTYAAYHVMRGGVDPMGMASVEVSGTVFWDAKLTNSKGSVGNPTYDTHIDSVDIGFGTGPSGGNTIIDNASKRSRSLDVYELPSNAGGHYYSRSTLYGESRGTVRSYDNLSNKFYVQYYLTADDVTLKSDVSGPNCCGYITITQNSLVSGDDLNVNYDRGLSTTSSFYGVFNNTRITYTPLFGTEKVSPAHLREDPGKLLATSPITITIIITNCPSGSRGSLVAEANQDFYYQGTQEKKWFRRSVVKDNKTTIYGTNVSVEPDLSFTYVKVHAQVWSIVD